MKNDKPTVEDILEIAKTLEEEVYHTLFEQFEDDERLYELDFKANLGLPEEFAGDGIVLPTARDIVDTAVDHTDIANARVFVNKKADRRRRKEGESRTALDEREMLRKFALGLIHRTQVESNISPWRDAGKHYWMHGRGVFKTVWDPDRWPDKPEQKVGESEDKYLERIDDWRSETHKSLPIVIQAVNPRCIMPDPATCGELFVIEKHERMVAEITKLWPNWTNKNDRRPTDMVVHYSYWDNKYRCEIVDSEGVLAVSPSMMAKVKNLLSGKISKGVYEHGYGCLPYTIIDSGLGNLSHDGKAEKRCVGLLRYIKPLLYSESRVHSLTDILMKREVLKGGYITGENAGRVKKLDQGYGKYTPLPDGVEVHEWDTKSPSQAVAWHQGNIADYIAAHGAPRSVRGMSEQGVRSGADRRLVIAEASAKYQYSKDSFRHGTESVLTKAAMILKNKVPDDVRLWAHTPTDEFDVIIKKDELHEPFVFFVEFAPISTEDEYRRHDDLERLVQTGIITPEFARQQMSNVDPIAMEKSELRERIKNDELVQQTLSQFIAGRLGQKLQALMPPQQMPMGQGGGQGGPPAQTPMGNMTTGIPNTGAPGQALQNQMAGMRSQKPINPTQGMGGGGSV